MEISRGMHDEKHFLSCSTAMSNEALRKCKSPLQPENEKNGGGIDGKGQGTPGLPLTLSSVFLLGCFAILVSCDLRKDGEMLRGSKSI